jgi:hypothetical protein
MRRGFLSAHGASLLGALASDGLVDPVERGDAQGWLGGNGSVAFPGDLEEAAPDVRPAEGKCDRIIRQLLVRRLAVTLHDAAAAHRPVSRKHFTQITAFLGLTS